MYCLTVYVPQSHKEDLKKALFRAGAGKIGHYDQGCWEILGQGQFRPLPGSRPFSGAINRLHQVPEWRLELVCEDQYVAAVVAALISTHPYESPPYHLLQASDPTTPHR